MGVNSEFVKKYSWVKSINFTNPEYIGAVVHTTFDPYDYEDLFDTQTGSWVDPDGDEEDTYFKVDDLTVDMHRNMFFIESQDDYDIFKVLQYIDEVIS